MLLFFLLFCMQAFSQTRTITGKITDSKDGSPLPGVSVTPTGGGSGTTTDVKGEFHLSVSAGVKSLTISFVGYTSRDIPLTGDLVNAALTASSTNLNEVIVIGYGTAKKKDLTGSITTVSSKDFNQGSISTPEQLIQGKIAGVVVTPNSGQPGVGSTIRIRGGTSISASNDPLIVIDGVPLNNVTINGAPSPLSLINPDDIETFTVLKDASATAIYGNRASNGVILITTKKGKSGAFHLSFRTLASASTKTKEVKVLNGDQIRSIVDTSSQSTAADKALLGSNNTNWQDKIYQTAFSSDNSVSMTGGIKGLPYRLTLGYMGQSGILKTGYLKRTSADLNLNPTFLNNTLKVDVNIRGVIADNRFANQGAIGDAIRMDPTQKVDSAGSPFGGYWEWTSGSGSNLVPNSQATRNPVAELMMKRDISNVKRLLGNVQIDYTMPFLPALRANMNVGYDIARSNGSVTIPENAAIAYTYGGSRNSYTQYNRNKLFDFYLNYNKNLKSINSRIDATVGYEYQDFYRATPPTTTYSLSGVGQTTSSLPDSSQNTLVSFYGRLNYTFMEKYLLTATIRRDGTSRFAPNNRWGNFPSLAFAWRMIDEDFMKDSKLFSDLKLRLGYGVTGNQDLGTSSYYSYLPNYTLSTSVAQYVFGSQAYYTYRGEAYDSKIKWEHTATYNAGLDFGFLRGRLSGTLDVYYKKTFDLLNSITAAAGSNLSNQVTTNVGNLENRGVELNLNALAVTTKDFTWNVGFNAAVNKNKILKLTAVTDTSSPGTLVGSISGGTGNKIQILSVGQAVNAFYVYKQVYGENGKPLEGVYADVNKDPGNLFYRYKSPDPKLTLGFNSRFTYKQWNFSFSMHGNFGNYMYNNVKSNTNTANSIFNSLSFIGNASTDYLYSGFQNSQYFSDYYVENASFVRMDNITLGYNFGKLINKTSNLRLSATVQNVFVITKYSGLDPEVQGGIDNNIYPKPRTYSLGVNLDL